MEQWWIYKKKKLKKQRNIKVEERWVKEINNPLALRLLSFKQTATDSTTVAKSNENDKNDGEPNSVSSRQCRGDKSQKTTRLSSQLRLTGDASNHCNPLNRIATQS